MGPRDVLKEYFGYDTFRTVQEDVISAILSGKDVLAIMPTGAGKSICFQIPAMLLPKGTPPYFTSLALVNRKTIKLRTPVMINIMTESAPAIP